MSDGSMNWCSTRFYDTQSLYEKINRTNHIISLLTSLIIKCDAMIEEETIQLAYNGLHKFSYLVNNTLICNAHYLKQVYQKEQLYAKFIKASLISHLSDFNLESVK